MRAGEQLEFLGDAVLDLVIADLLHLHLPDLDEGELSKRRATLVRTVTLAEKARGLGLDEALRLGRGEDRSGGREKASILAYVYEAVLGAVYRDGGFGRAARPDRAPLQGRHRPRRHRRRARLEDDPAGAHPGGAADRARVPRQRRERPGARAPLRCRGVGRRGTSAVGYGPSKRTAEQDAARAALEEGEG
jgi:ribonuclease-3